MTRTTPVCTRISVLSAVLMIAAVHALPPSFSQAGESSAPMIDLFPKSDAPTIYAKPSEFVVSKQYSPGQRRSSHWVEGVDERSVFHAYLTHKSTDERSWELRIGRGGQIYSITSSFGEAMPPQRLMSPFNDEVWQMVTFSNDVVDYDLEKGPGSIRDEINSFIHQSGLYVGRKQRFTPERPFYCPLLASRWDEKARTYTMINWGLCPTISINRSDVLFMVQFRDLGAGVIEMNHLCYNFGTFPLHTLATMWGGVRTSVFPELVLSNPDGSYRFHTPYDGSAKDSYVSTMDTGGWAAATQNAANPAAFALGLVFGRDPQWPEQRKLKHAGTPGWQSSPTVYGAMDARHGDRDYTVMNMDNRVTIAPGECFFRRTFMVIGTLGEVAEAGRKLDTFTAMHPVEFREHDTPLMPLYLRTPDKTPPQPTLDPPTPGAKPVCQLYAQPVKHSKPVFLLQDGGTGQYILTTDPALQCRKVPFENPYPAGDEKHTKFEHRVQYLTYQTRTKSWELLGYAMPEDKADTTKQHYSKLSEIPALAPLFQPGECAKADGLLLPAPDTSSR